jgi:TonB family protein
VSEQEKLGDYCPSVLGQTGCAYQLILLPFSRFASVQRHLQLPDVTIPRLLMSQQRGTTSMETWQRWEGRVVSGRFRLLNCLGGSEQSAVYLTEIDGSKVAIKLIPADGAQAQIQRSRWELASKLSHPHLLRILHTGRWRADDEGDTYFAVMEYADENLAQILPSRLLTPAEASEMLIPTLDVLDYLHGRGMIHGSIKPANIMAVDDELKLSSDGIRPIGESGESAETGNPYDAPENATGAISASSDFWSLGMTLVGALTNRLPTWDRTTENDPELPENIPQPFDDIAKHCLTRNPGRRWSTTEIRTFLDGAPVTRKEGVVDEQLSEVAEGRESPALAAQRRVPSPEAREPVVERPGTEGKRRGDRVAAAVIIVLVLVVAGVRLFRHSLQTQQPASATSPQPSAASPMPPTLPASSPTSRTNANAGRGAVAHDVLPDVSRKARDTISGTVTVKVKVDVDTSGAVSHAALVSSGGSGYFANQALQAARKWTFTPPSVDGKAMPSEWTLRFEFKRNGTKAVPQRMSPSL